MEDLSPPPAVPGKFLGVETRTVLLGTFSEGGEAG